MTVDESTLLTHVDAEHERTSVGLDPWPDPHAGTMPLDEEYSRVTDPEKWLIIGARCDAWFDALATSRIAVIERDAIIDWTTTPSPNISRSDRLVPKAEGALPIVVSRSRLGDADDAGITIGVGDPAICVGWIPDCGCDACDSGSQDAIEQVDDWMTGIVTGTFRRLTKRDREITTFGPHGVTSARNMPPRFNVRKILENPRGWHEVSGASWLQP